MAPRVRLLAWLAAAAVAVWAVGAAAAAGSGNELGMSVSLSAGGSVERVAMDGAPLDALMPYRGVPSVIDTVPALNVYNLSGRHVLAVQVNVTAVPRFDGTPLNGFVARVATLVQPTLVRTGALPPNAALRWTTRNVGVCPKVYSHHVPCEGDAFVLNGTAMCAAALPCGGTPPSTCVSVNSSVLCYQRHVPCTQALAMDNAVALCGRHNFTCESDFPITDASCEIFDPCFNTTVVNGVAYCPSYGPCEEQCTFVETLCAAHEPCFNGTVVSGVPYCAVNVLECPVPYWTDATYNDSDWNTSLTTTGCEDSSGVQQQLSDAHWVWPAPGCNGIMAASSVYMRLSFDVGTCLAKRAHAISRPTRRAKCRTACAPSGPSRTLPLR